MYIVHSEGFGLLIAVYIRALMKNLRYNEKKKNEEQRAFQLREPREYIAAETLLFIYSARTRFAFLAYIIYIPSYVLCICICVCDAVM